MRKFLIPLLLVAACSGAAVAKEAQTSIGTIHTIDAKACTLSLNGGKALYHFGPQCDFSKLKVGEKVSINWMAADIVRMASSVKTQ